MSEQNVLCVIDAGVATITLNRPDALNALNQDLISEFGAALNAVNADENVRCIVLEGAGRGFCAGVDLKMLQKATFRNGFVDGIFEDDPQVITTSIRQAPRPVIAKVHGFCFTGGLEIALHADYILTTEDTKFGDTHCKFGMRPSWGMSQNLARAVGVRRARQLSYTAATFTGVDAARWGLANEAYADKAALDEACAAQAAAITQASPGAVYANKDLYRLHEEYRALENALVKEVESDYPQITDSADRLAGFGA